MISFKNFLLERIVDPEQLAVRTAKIYGKRTNYGPWLKAEKHEHIPLSNYNRVAVNKVENKLYKYQKKLGMFVDSDLNASEEEKKTAPARANEAIANYKKKFSDKTMKISDLHATQPFIRTGDMEQLKNKISNKTSSDIMVIKHNDKHYIMDGHHTVMAAKFRGEKDVNVKYLDLDAETSKKKGVNEEINNHYTHLPDEPGTVPIPDGHIRLYHRTSINNMKSITKSGLSINHAKGYEGPKAIYADPKGFYGKPGYVGDEKVDVEFHVPKDKFKGTIVQIHEVPKENIIAIHQNWHNTARSIMDDPKTLSRVLSGEHDDLLDGSGGDQYKYSIKHIKHVFKESKIPHDRDTSENTTFLDEYFDIIEQMVIELSEIHNVDPDIIWDDFENVDDVELYETAAWRRKEGKSETGGLNKKGVESYRRENPGSNLQMAVTTKPSELKKDSKAYKRRKSFCARMSGMKGPMRKPNGEPTRKALALRKWNC